MKNSESKALIKDESGVALLMVITAIIILTIVMVDMSFSTQVSHAIARNRFESQQASELAKTGIQMAMLELEIHKQIADQITGKDPISKALRAQVDLILDFGFQYPPPVMEDLQESVKSELATLQKESNIRG
ncbi:hypothetical protein ACFLRA_04075, partial [Bdellovibrionota bacterium]